MSNDRKYREKRDHIVIIETTEGETIMSRNLFSDVAHELFAWLGHFPTLRTKIVQEIPVVHYYEHRELWVQEPGEGPTTHIADALREDDNEKV